jgi:hypothetical protein
MSRIRPQSTGITLLIAIATIAFTSTAALVVYGLESRPQVEYYLTTEYSPTLPSTIYVTPGQSLPIQMYFRNIGSETALLDMTINTAGAFIGCNNQNLTSCQWSGLTVDKGTINYVYWSGEVILPKNVTTFTVSMSVSKHFDLFSTDSWFTTFADLRGYTTSFTYKQTSQGVFSLD